MNVRFDEFVLDAETRTLWRHRSPVPLTSKAFDLLVLLVRERPKVLAKERLYEALWPGTHVTEASLHGLVSELRIALGDSPREPRFLRTVHRHGYAFQAEAIGTETEEAAVGPPARGPIACALLWDDRELALRDGENIVGRDPDLHVCIAATTVSRRHARIVIAGGEARIEDLESKNGTFVGGEPVTGPRPLRHGDEIQLGSVHVTFRAIDAFTATATVGTGP